MTAPGVRVELHVVREDGRVEALGDFDPERRRLRLIAPGFPFLPPGEHEVGRALPWVFSDMAPSGFLGARFARAFPELRLPERLSHWGDSEVLRALSARGEDLSGNLLIGDETLRRYTDVFLPSLKAGALRQTSFSVLVEAMLDAAAGAGSSLGGERPKCVIHGDGETQRELLLKFSPPLDTALGQRWANLYALEALCAQTLHEFGIDATGHHPQSFQHLPSDASHPPRCGLLLPRFDRTSGGGRIGLGSLYWLQLSRGGDVSTPAPEVMRSLARDGLVREEDVETVRQLHAFSAAIGNNDAHLGNYSLLFDAEGRARLAPAYDITAMVLAPVADELPDARVSPRARPVDAAVQPMVDRLIHHVRASTQLDDAFRRLWLRFMHAG